MSLAELIYSQYLAQHGLAGGHPEALERIARQCLAAARAFAVAATTEADK